MVYFILKWFIIFVTDAKNVLFDLDLLNKRNVYAVDRFLPNNIKKEDFMQPAQKRKFGFFTSLALMVGSIVGIGVFFKNHSIQQNVDNNGYA